MARARRNSGRPSDYDWVLATVVFPALSAGTIAATAFTANTPLTIMRIRGELLVYVDATQAPGGLASIGAGLIVKPADAGTTVTSSPLSDSRQGFMFYDVGFVGYEEYVTDVVDNPTLTAYRRTIDVKAMRKMRTNEELQLVVENVTELTAIAVNVCFIGRILAAA